MSIYYQEKIKYITEDLMVETYDLYSALKKLKTTLQDENDKFYWQDLYKLKVHFQIHTPDYELLDDFYQQGAFKSHEFVAIVDMVKAKIKSDITILTNSIDYTIAQYTPLKNSISIVHFESFEKLKSRNSTRIDNIELKFNLNRLGLKIVLAFLHWWNLSDLAFSKSIKVKIEGKLRGKSHYDEIAEYEIKKKPIKDLSNFVSINDLEKTNEFLGHKYYFELLKNYMFPDGFESQAEITLDIIKDEQFPQKRRTVSLDGSRMKFHQLITKITPHKEYQRIIKENRIVGIYCSVRSANDDLLYLLIDIDVPSIFYKIFPTQTVWELTLNIAKSITRTAARFGLPPFKVSFSGKKGLHLLFILENPQVIQDVEQFVNFSELYRFSLFPGMKTLKKEKVSTLNDKFKFAKSLLQSLLLYTVYKEGIEIPFEIRKRLMVTHSYQLFRLSVDAKNKLAILLDSSSMARGVFRICSPHLGSKLVSIPISDMRTGKICERYLDYENVREDARLKNVIEKFENNDVDLFLQKPNPITRDHIKNLLRPDKLLPAFATLLRFGTIYAIMRSHGSFKFWYRFFELRCFYAYVQDQVENYHGQHFTHFINFMGNMASRLQVESRDQIMNLIKLHLVEKKISYPLFKHWLNTYYYIEFFFKLKNEVFLRENEESLLELFQNEIQFSNFLSQAQEIFNIAVYTISSQVILEHNNKLSQEQIESAKEFFNDSLVLIDLARHYLSKLSSSSSEREERLIRAIHFISKLYFSSIVFLRQFYKLGENNKGIEIWR